MKLKHLLLTALCAVASVGAWAQTDVTSTYLTNADFEGTYSVQENPKSDRAIYAVQGWAVTRTNGEENDITGLKSGDMSWQGGFTPANSNGGSQTYWIRFRWGDKEVIKISQNVTLPAGAYKISADGLKNSANGTSVLSANGKSVSFTANAWETKYVEFTIYKDTEVEIALTATQKRQEESIFGYDNVKIEYTAVDHPVYTSASNLDFSESVLSVNVRTAAKDKTGTDVSGMQPVNGWIIPEYVNGAADNHASGVFAYGSSNFNGGSGYTAPANPGEATGNTLGVLAVWSATTQYVQPVKFLAGSYTLTIPVYNKTGGTQAITNLIGFVEGNGTTHYAATTQYTVDDWTNESIKLNFDNDTYGYFSLGYTSTGNGSGANPHLFVGAITIEGKSLLEGKKELAIDNATAATSLLSQKQYSGTKSALQTAIDNINNMSESITLEEVNGLIDALATAKTNAETSIADYALLNTNITYAEAYTPAKIDATGYADAVQAAKDAYNNGTVETSAAAIKPLTDYKVADYTWAKETYTEGAVLGTWTNTFAEKDVSTEGYAAGTTYYNEWGDNTRSIKQTVKLPAGDYILYGAGRGSIAAQYAKLYYKVGAGDPVEVNYLMKGNRGRGIETNGAANFSESGTYNCNNEGFGWEYRFIAFTLAEDAEVEIGTEAKFASTWVSVYAPQLYTKESFVKSLRLTEIATLLTTVPEGKMNAGVKSTLDAKKEAAQNATASNTKEELETIYAELNSAIADAKASIANYEKVVPINTKAAALDAEGITAYAPTLAKYNNGTFTLNNEVSEAQEGYIIAVKAQNTPGADLSEVMGKAKSDWTNATGTYSTGVERYVGGGFQNAEKILYQTISGLRPNEYYEVQFYAVANHARDLDDSYHGTGIAYVYANDTEEDVTVHEQGSCTHTNYLRTLIAKTDAEGKLEYGLANRKKGGQWYVAESKSLKYVGDAAANMAVKDGFKYGTFCAPFDVEVPAGVTASTATLNGTTIELESVGETIPANTPVILECNEAMSKTVYGKAAPVNNPTAGVLTGVYERTLAPVGSYVLQKQDETVAFYLVVDGQQPYVPANRAYLTTSTPGSAFYFDTETAIEAVEALTTGETEIYDLNGMKQQSLQKGINIVKLANGKTQKVLVK